MIQKSRQQAQAGADVIIWQEGGIITLQEDEARYIKEA